MKRSTNILIISVAVIIMATFSMIPHHHHNGLFCAAIEVCKKDHKINDIHTNHADATNNENEESTCVLSAGFVPPVVAKLISNNVFITFFLSICPLCFLEKAFNIKVFITKTKIFICYKFANLLKSVEISLFHSLGAPPKLLF